jgi:hypothetical protein
MSNEVNPFKILTARSGFKQLLALYTRTGAVNKQEKRF